MRFGKDQPSAVNAWRDSAFQEATDRQSGKNVQRVSHKYIAKSRKSGLCCTAIRKRKRPFSVPCAKSKFFILSFLFKMLSTIRNEGFGVSPGTITGISLCFSDPPLARHMSPAAAPTPSSLCGNFYLAYRPWQTVVERGIVIQKISTRYPP